MTVADVIVQRRAKPFVALRLWSVLGLMIAACAAAPFLGMPQFVQAMVIEILVFSLLALSLNVLLGYTGLVSFGHAAFFGIAGYAVGVIGIHISTDILVTFPLAVLVATICAVPIGWLSIRLSGFYFLMITFAFAQMVFVVAFRWKPVTGGSDGMIVPGATLFGAPILGSRESFYFFVLAVFTVCAALLYAIVTSRFGRTHVGTRIQRPSIQARGVRRWRALRRRCRSAQLSVQSVHRSRIGELDPICARAGDGSNRRGGLFRRADHWCHHRSAIAAVAEFLH